MMLKTVKKLMVFFLVVAILASASSIALADAPEDYIDESFVTTEGDNTIASGISNFVRTKTYQNQFADVSTSAWYYAAVKDAYEFGLVNGSSATSYRPNSSVTIAECIKLAVCIREIYEFGKVVTTTASSGKWYADFVDSADHFEIVYPAAYDRVATRAEVACILYGSFPDGQELEVVKNVKVPDVSSATPYSQQILALYRAGVFTGGDAQGNFYPTRAVTRSEVATIVNRLIQKESRVH